MKVGDWSTLNISNWIGRRGHVEWSSRSPGVISLVFFQGYAKGESVLSEHNSLNALDSAN